MKLHHTSNIDKQFATSDRKIRSLATTKRIVIPCESAYVLPAGASILAATQVAKTGNSETMGYKTYLYNKQVSDTYAHVQIVTYMVTTTYTSANI